MRRPVIDSFRLIAPIAAASFTCASALASYKVTFTTSVPLQNVFVSAHEFNGKVYAWDLFPIALGNVPAGVHTYNLGNHDTQAWAIFATYGASGVATSINDSLDAFPNGVDGLPFETVFPGYPENVVQPNIAGLYVGGAYNVQPAYYLFDFVLTNEDALKVGPLGTLLMYHWSNAASIGTAKFSISSPCPSDLNGDSVVNAADLAILLGNWGGSGPGDLDGDNTVNGADLAILLGAWGPCP
ncbi:MAG: hypothetical protein U0572_14840 [Phycisphaerales bacterium]